MDRLTLPLRAGLEPLLQALEPEGGTTRYVGGAVRDAIAGRLFADVDLATRLRPDAVMQRLQAAGIRAVPTGIAHGTVTAVLPGGPVEVTTLRRDVSTDGRRATVAYTDDWMEDASRRDFTINALYADPFDGTVHDPFGGVADLRAGRVRFIGDARARIAEDHLRILRLFRFQARYGRGDPDVEALAACVDGANSLMALSRERIADETTKLLASVAPVGAVRTMVALGILRPVLPEVDAAGVERLAALVAAEARHGIAGDPDRRLAALLPAAAGEGVARRLRLSNARVKRIAIGRGPAEGDARALAYRIGVEGAVDRLLLAGEDPRPVAGWTPPRLPISGGALVERGLVAGPEVARVLQAIERQWVAEGFPGGDRVDAIADAAVAQALAADR